MLKHLQSRADWEEKSLGAKGFTLIELLVVIVILGILAGVAIFAIGSIRKDASTAACDTEYSTIETAAEAYYTREGKYPATAQIASADGHLKKAPERWDYAPTTDQQDYTITAKSGKGCTNP